MTLNLVTTCDLATILQRPFFNLLHKTIRLVTLCDLVTVFEETKSVTKSRLQCTKQIICENANKEYKTRMLLQKIFRPQCELHAESFLSCLLREEGCSYSIETEIRVCQMPFYCASTVSFTVSFSWFALLA